MTSDFGSDELLSSMRSVMDGASLNVVGNVVSKVLGFLFTLLLTRWLGVYLYGLFAFGQTVVGSILLFANFGSDLSVVRFLSANRDDPGFQRRVLGLSYLTTLVASTLVGVGVFVLAPTITRYTLDDPTFTPVLRAFTLVVPFVALSRISMNSFQGLEMPAYQTLVKVLRPLSRLLFVGIAVLLGASILGVTVAVAAAGLALFVVSLALLVRRTGLSPRFAPSRDELVEYYDYSAPLTLSRAGSLLYNRVDIFMVGIFLASSDVAVYNVSMLLAGVIVMPLAGFNQLFPPVASRLYGDGDYETLESVYQVVTRWSITACLIIAAPLFLYRREVLAVFGEGFPAGAAVLVFFAVGQLVNAFSGPSNDLLTMTDHQYVVLVNHWGFGVLNVVLNYLFIQEFGMVGAALATASVLAMVNVTRLVEVRLLEGLFPYSAKLWKPLVAVAVAAAVMTAAGYFLSGIPLVVVGTGVGGVAYLAALYAFGIELKDRRLVDDYVDWFGE